VLHRSNILKLISNTNFFKQNFIFGTIVANYYTFGCVEFNFYSDFYLTNPT
jgi:hypothetical protein